MFPKKLINSFEDNIRFLKLHKDCVYGNNSIEL
jgi:hypothetical protein